MSVFVYLGNPVKGLLHPQKGHDTQVESHYFPRWLPQVQGQMDLQSSRTACGLASSSLFHVPDPSPAPSRVITPNLLIHQRKPPTEFHFILLSLPYILWGSHRLAS